MAKKGPEKRFEGELRKELERLGAIVYKLHGNRFQRDLPDCMVCFGGQIVMFETKADAAQSPTCTSAQLFAKLRPAQMYTLKKLKRETVRVYVWVVAGDGKRKLGYAARAGRKTVAKLETTAVLAKRILGLIK